jgi:sugar lactone lactonase YvrE
MPRRHRTLSALVLALTLLLLAIFGCRSTTQPKPSWTKAKVLADNEDHPSKIISDGHYLFYVTGGTVASKNEDTNNIKRIDLKSGTIAVLVKGGARIPNAALAVDEKFLYWSDGANILRVPKEGGDSEIIVPGAPNPDELLLDNDNIYWLIWSGEGSPPEPVMFAPRKGGAAKQLTEPQMGTSGLSLDKDFVYWMTASGIKRVPRNGGEMTEVYHNSSGSPSLGLAQDADNLYFCQMNNNGHSALMKLPKHGGAVIQLAAAINHTQQFVVDEANVYYFADFEDMGSFPPVALMRVPKSGGDPVTIDQGSAGWVNYLAVDGAQVYFTDISKVYAVGK